MTKHFMFCKIIDTGYVIYEYFIMNLLNLKNSLENLEKETVSNSFGGSALNGRAPNFEFKPIVEAFLDSCLNSYSEISENLEKINKKVTKDELNYIFTSLTRFAYLIELTNIRVTSTKMKTRWLQGKIIKTRESSFENFEGNFNPKEDQRSNSFEECTNIFIECIRLLSNSDDYINTYKYLANSQYRGYPHENIFDYLIINENKIHRSENIKLINLSDLKWLIVVRPIMYNLIREVGGNKIVSKIKTKSYKTDRSQTGEVQTNRAKRFECLYNDFQSGTKEDCLSVERKLLNDLCGFKNFPKETIEKNTFNNFFDSFETKCPITFEHLNFNDLISGTTHGESRFQVGHLQPLKRGGEHTGKNIAWISDSGNRIQGDLTIEETHNLIIEISNHFKS
jgi:hypothetical protein